MNIISRISTIGLDPDSPFSLRNKLKVFNIAVLSILLISLFYFTTALTHGYLLSTYATIYSVTSCVLILFLVHKRKYVFAYHFGMWYGLIFLSAFSFIFGSVTNSYLYFMFLPVACNILFDDKRVIQTYFLLIIVVTVGNFIVMNTVEPYYEVEISEKWLGYPNVAFVLVLIFLSVRMFKNENRKYASRIEEQRAILEQKNDEITDSINYAKRIQTALLAPAVLLQKHLPQHFVLYKPKDIVSGDFYFAAEGNDGAFWLCVGDCTGHGVPGAFMSLLNISVLRESIVDQKMQLPNTVLERQRDAIIAALNPHGSAESGKDGMDCVLMKFNRDQMRLQFACANNAVWIFRNGQLLEFKGDKQPVGLHEGVSKPFTLHEIELRKGDFIIAATDGFADQFGGDRGKKYKYSKLKAFLQAGVNDPPEKLKQKLSDEFEHWRGDAEQVDDVLIIGISV